MNSIVPELENSLAYKWCSNFTLEAEEKLRTDCSRQFEKVIWDKDAGFLEILNKRLRGR